MLFKNSINYLSSNESTETEEERKRRWFSIPYILKFITIFASILMIVSAILLATSGLSPYYLLAFAIMTAGSLILQGILEYANNKDNNIDPRNKQNIKEFVSEVQEQVEEIQSKRYKGSEAPNIKDEIAKLNLNIEKNLLVKKDGKENLEFSILDFAEAIAEDLYENLDECFESKEVKDAFDNLNNELVKSFPNTKKITLAELKKNVLDVVLNYFLSERQYNLNKGQTKELSHELYFSSEIIDYNKEKHSNYYGLLFDGKYYDGGYRISLNGVLNNDKEIKKELQDSYRKEKNEKEEDILINNSLLYRLQNSNEPTYDRQKKNRLKNDIDLRKNNIYNNISKFIENIIKDNIISKENINNYEKNNYENINQKQKEFQEAVKDYIDKNNFNKKKENIEVTDIKNLNEERKK